MYAGALIDCSSMLPTLLQAYLLHPLSENTQHSWVTVQTHCMCSALQACRPLKTLPALMQLYKSLVKPGCPATRSNLSFIHSGRQFPDHCLLSPLMSLGDRTM